MLLADRYPQLNFTKLANLTIVVILLLVTAITHQNIAIGQEGSKATQKNSGVTLEEATLLLNKTKGRLEVIPEDVQEDSFEWRLMSSLKKQMILTEELIALSGEKAEAVTDPSEVERYLLNKQAELKSLSGKEPLTITDPTRNEFDQLARQVKEQREKFLKVKEEINSYDDLQKLSPKQKEKAEEEKEKAQNLIVSLNDQILSEANTDEKELLNTQLTTAEIISQISSITLKRLKNRLNHMGQIRPALNVKMQIEKKRLEILEKELEFYSKAFEKELEEQHRKKEIVLAQKEAKLADATSPQEEFMADWEARYALSQRNKIKLETFVVSQQRIFDSLEVKLEAEKDKLEYFTNRLGRVGASGIPADRIKRELQRLKKLKEGLKKTLSVNYKETAELYESREFEIDDELQNFAELWREDFAEASKKLTQDEVLAFEEETSGLADVNRKTLNEEKEVLIKFIDLDQKIHINILERSEILDEIERIVWSTMFWIQDGDPINFKLFKKIPNEIVAIVEWFRKLEYTNRTENIPLALNTFNARVYGGLLFIALPVLLIFLRIKLARFAAKCNQKTLELGHRLQDKIAAVLTGVAGSITLPIYFYLASKIIGKTGLPENVRDIFVLICFYSGIFLFLFFLNRTFFRKQGIATVQFGLNIDSSKVVYRALCTIIVASISLRLFTSVTDTVFMISVIPQLLLFLELVIIGVTIWWAIRRKSALVQNEILMIKSTFMARYWTLISFVIFLIIIAIWILALTGYSYAASEFSGSLFVSIVVAYFLSPLYKLSVLSIENISLKRRRLIWQQTKDKEEEIDIKKEEVRLTDQAKSFVRVFFYVIGMIIIAHLWGLDDKAVKTFDEITVYSITNSLNEEEVVSVSDLLRFLLIILVTCWFLKNLKGVSEYAIFSRLKLEEGLKYAILTISRYGIFCISILFALSALHLDLGRLGWLMAAMGVGLGFGLQEIVSNFVCGIILLIERPIRVNDFVTIGANIGMVTCINIRATTITNFDRQEMIFPNRMLITQEVTNWTRSDNIIRLVVPVGVAYGSDTEKVSRILLEVAKDQPQVLGDPVSDVIFLNHGESSLDFELRVFLPTPLVKMEVLDNLNKEINRRFTEENVEIPFPQRDIHIRTTNQADIQC